MFLSVGTGVHLNLPFFIFTENKFLTAKTNTCNKPLRRFASVFCFCKKGGRKVTATKLTGRQLAEKHRRILQNFLHCARRRRWLSSRI